MKKVVIHDACETCSGLGHPEECDCRGSVAFLRGCCLACKGEGSKPVGLQLVSADGKVLRELRRGPNGGTILKDGDMIYHTRPKE